MTYWEKVASRLSVPGLALLVVGVAAYAFGPKLFQKWGDRAYWPVKIVGLLLALLGALILLDVFPGL